MFHFTVLKNPFSRNSLGRSQQTTLPPLLALPFLAGLFIGSVIGLFSDAPREMLSSFGLVTGFDSGKSFLHTVWYSLRFPFLAAILATGMLGTVMIPLLSALRGFTFACSIAAVIRPVTVSSFFFALLSMGLPALISLPAFFLTEADAFSISCKWLSRDRSAMIQEIPFLRHLFLILLLCTADAVYIRFLMPLLRGLL